MNKELTDFRSDLHGYKICTEETTEVLKIKLKLFMLHICYNNSDKWPDMSAKFALTRWMVNGELYSSMNSELIETVGLISSFYDGNTFKMKMLVKRLFYLVEPHRLFRCGLPNAQQWKIYSIWVAKWKSQPDCIEFPYTTHEELYI